MKYKDNATLGVGKLDFVIASGIKQKNIQDQFNLEKFLKMDEITPMQTSYTQTAVDREESVDKSDSDKGDESKDSPKDTEIEPSENPKDSQDKAPVKEDE